MGFLPEKKKEAISTWRLRWLKKGSTSGSYNKRSNGNGMASAKAGGTFEHTTHARISKPRQGKLASVVLLLW